MATSTNRLELYAAIVAVMGEVGYLYKEGRVEFGSTKYKYVGEAQSIQQLRPVMLSHGLFMVPVHSEATVSGKTTTVAVTYQLTHAPSGQSMPVSVVGQGTDTTDKGAPKAMTGALKYALRQAFMLETGDDPDKDASGKTAAELEAASEADSRRAVIESIPYNIKQINDCLSALKRTRVDILSIPRGDFDRTIKWAKSTKGLAALGEFTGVDLPDSTERASGALVEAATDGE